MDQQKIVDYYEGLLAQHGENYLALDWNSPESQRLRYKIFKEIFVYGKKTANISLLDLGCGFGDFYGFLKAEGLLHRQKISYTGYDISTKLVAVAQKKYPDAKFEIKDVLAERYLPKFDYVFCSGALNIRMSEVDDHVDWVKQMVYRMYDLSEVGTAINFLSEGALPASHYGELNAGHYFYFKPETVVNFCRYICNRYIVRHDYHSGDFTVYLFKQ